MEASALHAPLLGRRPISIPLLRLRSDEQLVALFRGGSEDAFAAIHDRYRQRLFAYVRQMLSAGSRADAEDVLQDVFVRAYAALRADARDVNVRAWMYRVAHNRCIDHLRRPTPQPAEVFEMSRTPLQDPIETAQRRDDLKRLVADVGRLPEQQRSALLMREIDGLAYADIAAALDVTMPAVKSLLVRARVGLVEAAEARDTDCALIRDDLLGAYDRGVKASARARRHMRECSGCREYRGALRGMRRSFASLSPMAGLGPLALAAKALGIGGAGGGVAAGGGAALGGGAGLASSGVAAATACKVAAVVCTAVVATGGAVEATKLASPAAARQEAASAPSRAPTTAPVVAAVAPAVAAPVSDAAMRHRTGEGTATARPVEPAGDKAPSAKPDEVGASGAPTGPSTAADGTPVQGAGDVTGAGTGGAVAPVESTSAPVRPEPPASDPAGPPSTGTGSGAPGAGTTTGPEATTVADAGTGSGSAVPAPAGEPAAGQAIPPSGPLPEH